MTKQKLGEYLCNRMYAAGIKDIFGVPGDFVLGFMDRIIESDINYIGCCNELNAAYAADGYARMNGIGALVTTFTVGELSAINGIAGSFAEGIPVVNIGGLPQKKFWLTQPLLHHTLGPYDKVFKCMKEFTISSIILDNPDTAAKNVDKVLKDCLLHKQPIYIGIPSDMIDAEINLTEGDWSFPSDPISDPIILNELMNEIVDKVSHAKKPIFIPGIEITRHGLTDLFEALIEKTNYLYTTMLLSKGILSENHNSFIGLYSGARSRAEIRNFVDSCDCVIILGEKLTDFNTGGFTVQFDPSKVITIEYGKAKVNNHYYVKVYLREIILELTNRLPKYQDISHPIAKKLRESNIISIEENDKKKLTNLSFFSYIADKIPQNSVVIAETGSSMFSAAEMLLPNDCKFICQVFYGSIGYTIGCTLGVCAAIKHIDPNKKVILFIGDGSLQVTVQDISTMIKNKFNPIIFCINNDGYTIERVIKDNIYNDIQMWDYASIPTIFGGKKGYKIQSLEDLKKYIRTNVLNNQELLLFEIILERFDCNDLLKQAGKIMAMNNNLLTA